MRLKTKKKTCSSVQGAEVNTRRQWKWQITVDVREVERNDWWIDCFSFFRLIPGIYSQCVKGGGRDWEELFFLVPHSGNIRRTRRNLNEQTGGVLHYIGNCWSWEKTKNPRWTSSVHAHKAKKTEREEGLYEALSLTGNSHFTHFTWSAVQNSLITSLTLRYCTYSGRTRAQGEEDNSTDAYLLPIKLKGPLLQAQLRNFSPSCETGWVRPHLDRCALFEKWTLVPIHFTRSCWVLYCDVSQAERLLWAYLSQHF